MSFRFIYRKIPASKRLCSYWRCQGQILRNLAQTPDGRLWHYGCLQTAKDEQYRCIECGSTLDGTQVSLCDYADGQPTLSCGECGSTIKLPSNFKGVMRIGNL